MLISICTDLCVKKDGLRFQVFNAMNGTITTTVPTKKFWKENCPGTKLTREMGEWEPPLRNRKIRKVLGLQGRPWLEEVLYAYRLRH
jgi:hypothetical protein